MGMDGAEIDSEGIFTKAGRNGPLIGYSSLGFKWRGVPRGLDAR